MKTAPTKKIRPRWSHWLFSIDMTEAAPEKVLRRFEKSQTDFDIAFLEDILATNPNHLDTLRQLASLYTENGQYKEGLEVDRRIVAACPRDAVAHYNLACSLSLAHRPEECFQTLHRALRLGYRDYEHMALDSDLDSIRKDRRWAELFRAPASTTVV